MDERLGQGLICMLHFKGEAVDWARDNAPGGGSTVVSLQGLWRVSGHSAASALFILTCLLSRPVWAALARAVAKRCLKRLTAARMLNSLLANLLGPCLLG